MRREELEAAVDRHAHLRGLLVVPWGIGLVILGLVSTWQSAQGQPPHLKTSAAFVVLALVALTVRRWYASRVGRATYRQGARHAVAAPLLLLLVFAGALLEQRLHGEFATVPSWPHHVSALTALSGLGMLVWHRLHVGPEPHHTWIWVGVLVLGCLPVWGFGMTLDPTTLVRSQAVMMLGGALVLSGVLDHGLLLSRLPPSEQGTGAGG